MVVWTSVMGQLWVLLRLTVVCQDISWRETTEEPARAMGSGMEESHLVEVSCQNSRCVATISIV